MHIFPLIAARMSTWRTRRHHPLGINSVAQVPLRLLMITRQLSTLPWIGFEVLLLLEWLRSWTNKTDRGFPWIPTHLTSPPLLPSCLCNLLNFKGRKQRPILLWSDWIDSLWHCTNLNRCTVHPDVWFTQKLHANSLSWEKIIDFSQLKTTN